MLVPSLSWQATISCDTKTDRHDVRLCNTTTNHYTVFILSSDVCVCLLISLICVFLCVFLTPFPHLVAGMSTLGRAQISSPSYQGRKLRHCDRRCENASRLRRCIANGDHFTKTGSGQTWGKHSKSEPRRSQNAALQERVEAAEAAVLR